MALTQITEKGIKDGEIVNADVNASAAIAKSKLAGLDIVNADVNASAAIAGSKLAASTTSVAGSMSAADKTKLDGVAASANNYTHPTSNGNKHIPADGSAGQFLKYDSAGTAVWAADNNTVYTHPNHSGDVTSSGDGATTIADNAVTLAKMAGLARGKIIYGDASGDPAALTVGSSGQVLKSDGTDISWGTDSGGKLLQVADTFESDEVLVSTHGTWTDLDTSVTITPTDATTKMIIWARVGGIWQNSTTNWIGVRLIGTATSMTEYNKTLEMHYGYYTSSGANNPIQGWRGPVSVAVVHDHNQTNAITYKLQAIVYDHSDDEATFMMWGNDNNQSNATIIVQEFST